MDFTSLAISMAIATARNKYYDSRNSCNTLVQQHSVFLNQLIVYNEEHNLMDDLRLGSEVLAMFFGAHEPPAVASSFLLLMLAMHPEIQEKVRAEVQEVIGDGNITARNATQLKYLEMVIKETIRLFPIGVVVLRETTDDIIFSSFTAPKGCTIAMFLFMTNRDPKLWKDPNKFDPDRFLPENSVGRHPYAFVSFSSGLRGCIGKQYGMIMIKTLMVNVLQKYKLHSNGSSKNFQMACNPFARCPNGYKISITRL